jgi:hypothetical protein
VERAQLEMQLVVARVAAAAAVVSEASARTSLEVARQFAEDRATTAQTAATAAVTERDLLASRLALAEAEVEKLRAATVSTEEAAERVRTAAAAQAAVREKATLKARLSKLESDLGTATTDLAVGRQFSQVTNQLQVVFEEATQLRESNTKLSEVLEGESRGCFLYLFRSLLVPCCILIRWSSSQGRVCTAPDDHEVGGSEVGAENQPPQGH